MLNATIIAFAFMKKVNSYLKESADRIVYKIDMKWISQTFILLKYTLLNAFINSGISQYDLKWSIRE